jgi:predicted  nucleic acid-binding Zn-ribbon protein
MKRLTLTTIGTLAAVLAFSTGCSQSKRISELETDLERVVIYSETTQHELATAQHALTDAKADRAAALLQLAAKDKKISELKAQLSAVLERQTKQQN